MAAQHAQLDDSELDRLGAAMPEPGPKTHSSQYFANFQPFFCQVSANLVWINLQYLQRGKYRSGGSRGVTSS